MQAQQAAPVPPLHLQQTADTKVEPLVEQKVTQSPAPVPPLHLQQTADAKV
jgi:hypothetical protein